MARARRLFAPLLIRAGRSVGLARLMKRFWFRRLLGDEGRAQAWRALGARIDPGARLGANVWLGRHPRNVSIGAGCKLGGHVTIESAGTTTIGRNTILNDSDLLTTTHDIDHPGFKVQPLSVTIGEYAWLPRKIIVLPGVRIGDYAVIGTGSVVAGDIPDYGVAVGNPATVVKERARIDYRYVPADISRTSNELARRGAGHGRGESFSERH